MLVRRALLVTLCTALFATEPNDATRRWWSHVQALSNDSLEGRDTGSKGYRTAARYVVAQFERAGLKAAGEMVSTRPSPYMWSASAPINRTWNWSAPPA